MSNRRGKSSKKQKDDSQSSEEKLIVDPYEIIATPVCVCSPEDHIRKKNCAKNPWCLFGLGEKEGIWRNSNTAINSLGLDPNVYLRKRDPKQLKDEVLYPPAGLRNLGATCYLNVLIQSLFHNLLVQDAVFNMEVDKVKNDLGSSNEMVPVILALQTSFAHMKLCHDGVVDLTQFVELLGLNKSTQQDPQEFNKLFLAKIESANLTTTHPSRATFNELLSGRVKYVTRCRGCGTERAPPEHPFHELDLSVEGVKSVEEALLAYQAVEVMSGENQYECSVCNGRRDAERCTVILKAPSVLNLHLLRYGYDRETYERKKLTAEVTFRDTIEVCGEQFKLVSVLYHKGRSAYGGHYVCDALDWHSGEWWHYDDDTVFATTHPATNPTNTTNSKAGTDGGKGRSSGGDTLIDLVDSPTSTPSKSPRSRATTSRTSTTCSLINTMNTTNTTSTKRIQKRKSIVYNEATNSSEEEEEEEFEEVAKGKNKRAAAGSGASSSKGKGGTSSAKKGPANKKQRGAAGGAVEVQDLTARDGNDNNNSDTAEQAAAGAKQTAKLGFNRKRDAYMLTYVRIEDYTHTMNTTRVPPSATLCSVVGSASSAFDSKVNVYNTNKEALLREIAQRKEVYDMIRSEIAPVTFDNSGASVVGDKFKLVPAWWLNKYIKGDISTLRYSGSNSSSTSSSDGGNSGSVGKSSKCCSGDVMILDSDTEQVDNITSSNTIANTTNTTSKATNSSSNNTQDESQGFEIVDTTTTITNTNTNTNSTTIPAKCDIINTNSYLCRHGLGLDTTHLERFKVISNTAYNTIFADYWQHISHEFNSENYRCSECFDSVVHQRRTVQSLFTQYDTLLTQISDTSTNIDSSSDSEVYWLSKTWLTQLRKYHTSLNKAEPGKGKAATYANIFSASNNAALHTELTSTSNTNTSSTGTANKGDEVPMQTLDPLVNNNLFCPHNNPSLNYSKKAVKITSAAWCTLCTLYPAALPIIEGSAACSVCASEASDTMENNRMTKLNRLREIEVSALNTLYKAKRIYPATIDEIMTRDADNDTTSNANTHSITNYTTNTTTSTNSTITTQYAVIDGMWLAHWRKYIQDPLFPAPPALTNTALMCRCSGGIGSNGSSAGGCGASGGGTSGRPTRHATATNTSSTTPSAHSALLPPCLAGIEHSISPTMHDVHDLVVYKFSESDVGISDPDCMIVDSIHTTNTSTSTSTAYPRAEIITTEQWNALLVFHSPNKCEPEVIDLDSDNFDNTSTSANSDNVYTLLLQYHHTLHTWQYAPSLCAVCESTLQASANYSAAVYSNASISVVYFRDEMEFRALFPALNTTTTKTTDAANSTANTNTANTTDLTTSVIDEPRRSKRSRGSKSNATICADSTDTLSIVRLKVYQAFDKLDLPPSSQVLFDSRGVCMNSNVKTLAEYNVKKGDKIYVLEGSNPSDSADWEYIDFFHTQGSGGGSNGGVGGRAIEKGFGGTLLQGGPMGGTAGAGHVAGASSGGADSGGSGSSSAGSSAQDADATITSLPITQSASTTTLQLATTTLPTSASNTTFSTFSALSAPLSPQTKEVKRNSSRRGGDNTNGSGGSSNGSSGSGHGSGSGNGRGSGSGSRDAAREVYEIIDSPAAVTSKHNTHTTTVHNDADIDHSTATTTHKSRTTRNPDTTHSNTAHATYTALPTTTRARSTRTSRTSATATVDADEAALQAAIQLSLLEQEKISSGGSGCGGGNGTDHYAFDNTLYSDSMTAFDMANCITSNTAGSCQAVEVEQVENEAVEEVESEDVEHTQCSDDEDSPTQPQTVATNASNSGGGRSSSSGGSSGGGFHSQVYEPLLVDEPFLVPPLPQHAPTQLVSKASETVKEVEVEVVELDTQTSALYHTPPSPPASSSTNANNAGATTTPRTSTTSRTYTSTSNTNTNTTHTTSHKRKQHPTYELEDGETFSSTSGTENTSVKRVSVGASGGDSVGGGVSVGEDGGSRARGDSEGSAGSGGSMSSRVRSVVRNAPRTSTAPVPAGLPVVESTPVVAAPVVPPVRAPIVPAPVPIVPVPVVPVVPVIAAPVTSPSAPARGAMVAISAYDLLAMLGRKTSASVGSAGSVTGAGGGNSADESSVVV